MTTQSTSRSSSGHCNEEESKGREKVFKLGLVLGAVIVCICLSLGFLVISSIKRAAVKTHQDAVGEQRFLMRNDVEFSTRAFLKRVEPSLPAAAYDQVNTRLSASGSEYENWFSLEAKVREAYEQKPNDRVLAQVFLAQQLLNHHVSELAEYEGRYKQRENMSRVLSEEIAEEELKKYAEPDLNKVKEEFERFRILSDAIKTRDELQREREAKSRY